MGGPAEKETPSRLDFPIDRQTEYSDDMKVKLITSYSDLTASLWTFGFSCFPGDDQGVTEVTFHRHEFTSAHCISSWIQRK